MGRRGSQKGEPKNACREVIWKKERMGQREELGKDERKKGLGRNFLTEKRTGRNLQGTQRDISNTKEKKKGVYTRTRNSTVVNKECTGTKNKRCGGEGSTILNDKEPQPVRSIPTQ